MEMGTLVKQADFLEAAMGGSEGVDATERAKLNTQVGQEERNTSRRFTPFL